jgi:hypothetical protein
MENPEDESVEEEPMEALVAEQVLDPINLGYGGLRRKQPNIDLRDTLTYP